MQETYTKIVSFGLPESKYVRQRVLGLNESIVEAHKFYFEKTDKPNLVT